MNILLHPDSEKNLSEHYQRAFQEAIELFIVTAYLTEWDETLTLNPDCHNFRIIIGKDFGITRRAACEAVMRWLPSKRKGQFMVADMISGFHPKAVFWKDRDGNCFTIIGSSNLTHAAFNTNFEANVFSSISTGEYSAAKIWVKSIEKLSVPISEDWLNKYKEAIPTGGTKRTSKEKNNEQKPKPVVAFNLPRPQGMRKAINRRRIQLATYNEHKEGLIGLFRRCSNRNITSNQFYEQVPNFWSYELNDRLQGSGWERKGKDSNFRELSESYIRILDATDEDRDDVVAEEIDSLEEMGVSTRGAFLSEMLCLQFPNEYPVLNKPIKNYLKSVNFKAPRGASEGVRYIDLAKKLRTSLLHNPNHPAKNLAELDTVIWLAFAD